jgi:quercetin dioxygenase-like cupin family protein
MTLSRFLCTCAIVLPLASAAARKTDRAQDLAAIDPNIAKVEFENDQVRVLRVSYAPHQKSPMHRHPGVFVVSITGSDLHVSFPDGTSRNTKHAAHQFFWSEPITHQVENVSSDPMQNIEVELKQSKGAGVEAKPTAPDSQMPSSNAKGTDIDPVPVEQEPHHHLVFANQYVRVLEVIVKPGETTLFHKHSLDNVAVILTGTALRNQVPGQEWTERPTKDGSVGFAAGTAKPYVHRISNAGSAVFHVLDIQILP